MFICLIMIFFFFQAEDGIRVRNVTGVQTCALPISLENSARFQVFLKSFNRGLAVWGVMQDRSEERRVGKECRSRWLTDNYKKKRTINTHAQMQYIYIHIYNIM